MAKLKSNKTKILAPLIVSGIFIIYFIVYFGILISLLNGILKFALGIIPLILSIIMIKVCVERINEIKKGEEDDISKY